MRTIIVAVVILLLTAAGYFGHKKYEEHKFVESITLHVKNASVRVANAVRYNQEPNKITYNEFFAKLDTDVSDIDKRILEIQISSTPVTKEKTDAIVSYLRACQRLLRSIVAKDRKSIAVDSTVEWARQRKEYVEDVLDNGSSIVKSTLKTSLLKATKESMDALKKAQYEWEEAISDLSAAARELSDSRSKVLGVVSVDSLIDSAALERIVNDHDIKKLRAPKPSSEKK